MIKKTIYLASIIIASAIVVSCGSSSKEKAMQEKIAELESQVEATKPISNSTTPEVEVKPEGPSSYI